MNQPNLLRLAALPLALCTLAAIGSADAAVVDRSINSNAGGLCQAALPAYDGLIRKRPLAVQNEGTADAFITCALTSVDAGAGNPEQVDIYARSNNGVAHTVTCTAVSGFAADTNQFVAKTITVPADGSQVRMTWLPADFTATTGTLPSKLLSASCVLPPGSGLNDTYVFYGEEIGG